MSNQDHSSIHNQANLAEENTDPTVSKLLVHLKAMRESVPVNYQLKQDLKKRLMEQMTQGRIMSAVESRKKPIWLRLLPLLIVFMFAGLTGWLLIEKEDLGPYGLKEIHTPAHYSVSDVGITSDGKEIVLLSQNQIYVLNNKGEKINTISAPGKSTMTHLSVGPENKVAIITDENEKGALWIVDLLSGGSRFVWGENHSRLENLQWSADGKWIFVEKQQEIWKVSTMSTEMVRVGNGIQPYPSPDGLRVAAVWDGKLVVIENDGNTNALLENGTHPMWNTPNTLMFLDSSNKINTVQLVDEGKKMGSMTPFHHEVEMVSCSSDGKWAILVPKVEDTQGITLWMAKVRGTK